MFISNIVIACCLLMFRPLEAARILAVFPIPSISHQVVFRPITQELAKRGHDVVVITPDPAFAGGNRPQNLTEIDVHDISYKVWRETFMKASRGNADDLLSQMTIAYNAIVIVVEALLNNEEVQIMMRDKNQKFDLILSEACVRPALIFSHIYDVPVIQVSSLGAFSHNYITIGAPTHPFLYPTPFQQRLSNLTLWEKITLFYSNYLLDQLFENMKVIEYKMLQKYFGNNTPTIDDLLNKVHMLFLNVDPIFEGNRPVPASVIYMGGLHQNPDKELPDEYKSYLDSSKNGVIYLSFGTNVDTSTLPTAKIQTLVRALSKLPYDVLWKWNKNDLPGRTENIRISKWMPQSDLLKHPKIKLFITQGGLQSTDEAITAGVPLIGIPMLGDQWFNVEKYVHHKIGIRLDLDTITEEKLTQAINTILTDNSYRQNVRRLRELIRDQPMKPLERAVWWTEYVLRHGGARHLRSPAANITWTQYLELELIGWILVVLFLAILLFIIAFYFIYQLFGNVASPGKVKRT